MTFPARPAVLTMMLLLFLSCEAPSSEAAEELFEPGRIQILYQGVTQTDPPQAHFLLYNDSTVTIQYFAYDVEDLHYSTETLTDTGWAYLMWNWCGTGAEYFDLRPQESIHFQTALPQESCTWRVLASITIPEQEYYGRLYSEALEYNTQE